MPELELDRFVIPYTSHPYGLKQSWCGVREYPNDTFIIEPADGTPLTLHVMPQISKSLYNMGFREFTIVVRKGDRFKGVTVEDAWERGKYAPHSPSWERITREQVEEMIGGELVNVSAVEEL